ncbi:MAG TPA: NADPH-dependent 7-cyano-7-deazaguanine reductase QueF [Candidatus Marinimicrobia bacterium]|nr:NADPH-dependent 7-cyano-7-deazaguanine reductase QueF [Candidatus Neomarinimicrobiota bacterium]
MAKAEGLSLPFYGPETIRADMLEPIDYHGNEQTITLEYPEFSAVCPYSGLPDIARITIEYIPNKKIIELKSLKYYFISYRNVGIYQEDMTDRVYNDLKKSLNPKKLRVTTLYNVRGGIETRCVMGSI